MLTLIVSFYAGFTEYVKNHLLSSLFLGLNKNVRLKLASVRTKNEATSKAMKEF